MSLVNRMTFSFVNIELEKSAHKDVCVIVNESSYQITDWFKKWTVPNTKTTKGLSWDNHLWQNVVSNAKISPSAYAVAVGTWWSLSEGILDEPYSKFNATLVPNVDGYLFNYNLCSETVNEVTKSNVMKGPNDGCLENAPNCGSCWQNGIFGMEMNHTTAVEVATAAENIYEGKTYWTVIKETMNLAGFNSESDVYKTLLKYFPNDASVPALDDNLACLNSSSDYPSWCMVDTKFSNGFEGVNNTINILANYYAN
ncbi:17799_t:CDS:2 [Racocetra fulgida]|uniref:17799_t:CDS:1 n=1 Tax=Racocetra fulgida TaxID=60492 RepID=A0A9N8YZF3_9GLOM|nr:17799_t:CDS:2 [Racocetra fulgida]